VTFQTPFFLPMSAICHFQLNGKGNIDLKSVDPAMDEHLRYLLKSESWKVKRKVNF